MRNGYGTSTWESATEDPQKLAEDIALVVLEPREPADEEEWAAFLDQFGDKKWKPGGELKGWRDFTDPFNKRTAFYVWNGWPEETARAKARIELALEAGERQAPPGGQGRSEADRRLAWEAISAEIPDELVWDTEAGPGTATVNREGYGYRLLPVVEVGGPAQTQITFPRESGGPEERPSSREQTERQAWRDLILSHSMFDPDALTLPIAPGPVGPPDGFREVQQGVQARRLQARSDYPGIQAMTPPRKHPESIGSRESIDIGEAVKSAAAKADEWAKRAGQRAEDVYLYPEDPGLLHKIGWVFGEPIRGTGHVLSHGGYFFGVKPSDMTYTPYPMLFDAPNALLTGWATGMATGVGSLSGAADDVASPVAKSAAARLERAVPGAKGAVGNVAERALRKAPRSIVSDVSEAAAEGEPARIPAEAADALAKTALSAAVGQLGAEAAQRLGLDEDSLRRGEGQAHRQRAATVC